MIKELRDGVIQRVSTLLGTEFVKLSFTGDISANKFGRASKRFGVIPKSGAETDGFIGTNTIDHKFEIILTDSYSIGATNQVNDDLKLDKISFLQDKALQIYRDLQINKSVLSSQVLVINGIQLNEIEFLEEEKVAVLKIDINIKYRV